MSISDTSRRRQRESLVADAASTQGGVMSRAQLSGLGISRHEVWRDIEAGRWRALGWHTIAVTPDLGPHAIFWRAVWEAGRSARLDGSSSLIWSGLQGWRERLVHVSVPHGSRCRRVPGVRVHVVRGLEDVTTAGLPRSRPEIAAVRAARWAASDRQAVTVLAMSVQQRIVHSERLLAAWSRPGRRSRRALLDAAIRDICDGAHSLNELDFAALCRHRRLPTPSRQVLRHGPQGRIYLDVIWEDLGLVVEVDGWQHLAGLGLVDDALRDNTLALSGEVTLRIPVLGLRLCPDLFMDQVERAIGRRGRPLR